jgi:hypothetical protein
MNGAMRWVIGNSEKRKYSNDSFGTPWNNSHI